MNLLVQLASFVRIVELGSLSAAARAQKLSLPAISRQLAELERELGAPLVLRSTRRLSVTERGRAFYERAVRILRDVDEARESVVEHGVRGTLVVSAGVTLGQRWLLPRLLSLHQRHRDLVVELRLEDDLVDLLADGIDVAVRGGVRPPDSAGLIAQRLIEFDRVLVAAPSYLRKRRTPRDPAVLAEHDCLVQVGRSGPYSKWTLVGPDRSCDVTVRGPFRSSAPGALREAALAGLGVALLPPWLVGDDLAVGALRRVLPAWASGPVGVWAIWRVEHRGSPRVAALVDALRSD